MIKQAKQTRLEKRGVVASEENNMDFIRIADGEPMEEDDIEPEMRMEIDEVEEAYEDNKGATISFGADSILNAEERRRKQFRDNLMDAYGIECLIDRRQADMEEDPELQEWEADLVRHGVKKGDKERLDNLVKSRRGTKKQAKGVR
jgi:hypothetical protein